MLLQRSVKPFILVRISQQAGTATLPGMLAVEPRPQPQLDSQETEQSEYSPKCSNLRSGSYLSKIINLFHGRCGQQNVAAALADANCCQWAHWCVCVHVGGAKLCNTALNWPVTFVWLYWMLFWTPGSRGGGATCTLRLATEFNIIWTHPIRTCTWKLLCWSTRSCITCVCFQNAAFKVHSDHPRCPLAAQRGIAGPGPAEDSTHQDVFKSNMDSFRIWFGPRSSQQIVVSDLQRLSTSKINCATI